VGTIFTFRYDILTCVVARLRFAAVSFAVGVRPVASCVSGLGFRACCRCLPVVVVADIRAGGCWPGLGRPRGGEVGECLAAASPGFRGKPGGGAALVFFLACVPRGEDALVAGDEQCGGEQHERG
jgi:hypothetical protein